MLRRKNVRGETITREKPAGFSEKDRTTRNRVKIPAEYSTLSVTTEQYLEIVAGAIAQKRERAYVGMLGTRGKRIRGRVVGNKKDTETRKVVRRRWNSERASERERERAVKENSERERSSRRGVKGIITPAGRAAGRRAGASRRMVPRRVVRLGYQMVRTSSRCTRTSHTIARATPPASTTGGFRVRSGYRHAACTFLFIPIYPAARRSRSAELPRSRSSGSTISEVDRASREYRAFRAERGRRRKEEAGHSRRARSRREECPVDMIGLIVRRSMIEEGGGGGDTPFNPENTEHHRVDEFFASRICPVVVIVVVRKRGTYEMVREISGAQETLTPNRRPPKCWIASTTTEHY